MLTGILQHISSGLLIGVTSSYVIELRKRRRLHNHMITWDYIKKHPEDFPEVFNRIF